jgi:N-acylglucosamine-6-phosphate 2-epimerase
MSSTNNIFASLKGHLVVSCQAEPPSPFDNPRDVASFARCAIMGGAAGIRSCGVEKIKAILEVTDLPVIGLTKGKFPDGTVCITGSFAEVESLVNIGTPIIAVDGTFREREGSLTGPQYIAALREKYPSQLLMADISTPEEALACRKAGADCVSTTLAGYTPATQHQSSDGPSLDVLEECVALCDCPVFAEGRYNTPAEAAMAIAHGAHAVVVGSAITRPHLITEWFVKAIQK